MYIVHTYTVYVDQLKAKLVDAVDAFVVDVDVVDVVDVVVDVDQLTGLYWSGWRRVCWQAFASQWAKPSSLIVADSQ